MEISAEDLLSCCDECGFGYVTSNISNVSRKIKKALFILYIYRRKLRMILFDVMFYNADVLEVFWLKRGSSGLHLVW